MSRPQRQHEPLLYSFTEILDTIADENKPEIQAFGGHVPSH